MKRIQEINNQLLDKIKNLEANYEEQLAKDEMQSDKILEQNKQQASKIEYLQDCLREKQKELEVSQKNQALLMQQAQSYMGSADTVYEKYTTLMNFLTASYPQILQNY